MNNEIKFKDIINNKNMLSPSNYSSIVINSKIQKKLSELVLKIEKGTEVGSNNYVSNSPYKFIRTSSITESKFSIVKDERSILDISSTAFVNYGLHKDDILICKDSNVGEVVLLDKDYSNYMFSSGINRIIIPKYKYYVFAIMKHNKFKKQLMAKIPKGATLMHAKELYLDCIIPFPNENDTIDYIEKLVRIISNKEKEITNKVNKIEQIISNEIISNQNNNSFQYNYPSINQLIKINRLDTGNYTEEFSKIDFLIKNYKYGYFYIEDKNIKGGNTPKTRVIDTLDSLKYYWITPSFINNDGTIDMSNRITCDKNNINQNCALIINRTSKGGTGEYVGITAYYDYDLFGKAQHNQGIYKIYNMSDSELIYISCLMNSKMYRKYCANLSMGSKMKELKLNNILSIPFPKFMKEKQEELINLYYNKLLKQEVNLNNMEVENANWDKQAGIVDLYKSLQACKKLLNEIIDDVYLGNNIIQVSKIF